MIDRFDKLSQSEAQIIDAHRSAMEAVTKGTHLAHQQNLYTELEYIHHLLDSGTYGGDNLERVVEEARDRLYRLLR